MSLIDFASSFDAMRKIVSLIITFIFQVYNFILVSARKGLTKDYLSSIVDKKSTICRVYSTKIVIDVYYKRQKIRRGIYES